MRELAVPPDSQRIEGPLLWRDDFGNFFCALNRPRRKYDTGKTRNGDEGYTSDQARNDLFDAAQKTLTVLFLSQKAG